MPYYAVAVGRTPGVFKTWEECQNQTKGYPQAKFRKFNTEREATEFVKEYGSAKGENAPGTSLPVVVENLHLPELKPLGKYSSQALLKQDRLSLIEEKLDSFIEQTNKILNKFSKKLDHLELFLNSNGTPIEKKRTTDDLDEEEDQNEPKKKKTLAITYSLESVDISESSKSKSKSTNKDSEEVDYPWQNRSNLLPEGFIVDQDGFTIVYTDGACTNNGRQGAKAGIGVWFNHRNPFNVAAPVNGSATNNNAEIQAATRAIEQASLAGIRKLNICTDSQFMINCMTDWIKKWKKNDWKTSTGGKVKNKEQLVLLDEAIQKLDAVKWTHVRGHMGNEGNECADALARSGAASY